MNRLPRVLQNEIWEYVRGDRKFWRNKIENVVDELEAYIDDLQAEIHKKRWNLPHDDVTERSRYLLKQICRIDKQVFTQACDRSQMTKDELMKKRKRAIKRAHSRPMFCPLYFETRSDFDEIKKFQQYFRSTFGVRKTLTRINS
jgi:hypothetical protein